MKKLKIIIALMFILNVPIFSQADKVIGIWLTSEVDSQIEIFKTSDGKYSGRIVWVNKNLDAKDDKNPNLKLKDKKIMGLQILNNFTYNKEDKEWVNGTVYDPNKGKTYECYMWFENNFNEFKIKGFVLGVRLLGRETSWKRENNLRKINDPAISK